MKSISIFFISLSVSIFFSGCVEIMKNPSSEEAEFKVQVDSIYSEGLKNIILKEIYILDFKRDAVDLADNLCDTFSEVYIEDGRFYDVSRRNDLALIVEHEKYDTKEAIHLKKDEKEYFIISGEVLAADYTTEHSIISKVDYDNCLKYDPDTKECKLYPEIEKLCTKNIYSVGAKVLIRDMSNSEIIMKGFK